MKKHIPNLLTLGNLFCGILATIFAVQENYNGAALFVVLGIAFDFFDGFVARLLQVSGELGKQLDSLADMVTSGVVPGVIMFNLLEASEFLQLDNLPDDENVSGLFSMDTGYLKFLGLLLALGACYRLAKFAYACYELIYHFFALNSRIYPLRKCSNINGQQLLFDRCNPSFDLFDEC